MTIQRRRQRQWENIDILIWQCDLSSGDLHKNTIQTKYESLKQAKISLFTKSKILLVIVSRVAKMLIYDHYDYGHADGY